MIYSQQEKKLVLKEFETKSFYECEFLNEVDLSFVTFCQIDSYIDREMQ